MATQNLIEPLKDGTVVRILHSGYEHAEVAEYRGPLGPKGARVYLGVEGDSARRERWACRGSRSQIGRASSLSTASSESMILYDILLA
jgi:hypothetical protein